MTTALRYELLVSVLFIFKSLSYFATQCCNDDVIVADSWTMVTVGNCSRDIAVPTSSQTLVLRQRLVTFGVGL